MKSHKHERPAAGDESGRLWQTLSLEAQDKPWLLRLFGERSTALYLRFRVAVQHLQRLRPGQLRRLQRRLGLGLAGTALLLALSGGPLSSLAAPAASIDVDGTTCTLTAAIDNANSGGDTDGAGGCNAGSAGADTLTITNNINLTTALPDISSVITLQGGGHTVERTGGSGFSVLKVTSTGNLTLNSATISGGSANEGGGIFNNGGTVTVQNSTLSGNSAGTGGGGIGNRGTVTVQNSTLSVNSALNGSGIYNRDGILTVQNSTLSGGSASRGGIFNNGGTVTVQNSTLSGNSAGTGGGIFNGGNMTVQNSTLSGNSATFGGGILNYTGFLRVQNSTLSGNSAFAGGGIRNGDTGTVTVLNSIIANSTAGGDCQTTGGTTSSLYSLIEGNGDACGKTDGANGNIVGQDPSLGAGLIPNGDSPAIDAGNPATPGSGGSACLTNDKRGQARDDLRCDMGAFEVKLSDHDTIVKNIGGAGTFTFGPTLAKIVVNNVGSSPPTGPDSTAPNAPSAPLTSLSVKRVDGNHPNAATANMQTGRYWTITPSSGASGYNIDLTLPATFTPDANDKLCRYTGSGWDCAASGFDASTITRAGVTQLSDWTAGNDVKANPVRLQDFSASGGSGGLTALWAGLAALLAGLGLALRRRVGGQRSEVSRALVQADAESGRSDSIYPFDKRLTSPLRMYHPPAIAQRGTLKQFAGSPLAPEPDDPLDILGLGN